MFGFGAAAKSDIAQLSNELNQFRTWFQSAMTMVDNVPLGIIWCNAEDNFTITYANTAAKEILSQLQGVTGINPDQLHGQTIDFLFKHSSTKTPNLRDRPSLPYRSHVAIGADTIDLRATAVCDGEGKYCGAMITFSVITAQVRMAADFESRIQSLVSGVSGTATTMEKNARDMVQTADQTNTQAAAVAAAAEQSSVSVQTVAAAAEELTGSIDEISRQVQTANSTAQTAVSEAGRTNAMVNALEEAAQKIGEVVSFISDIAAQTNLLALNATIEAARAGDAGKGFAVVAGEVKGLANQTAKATDEIAAQIATIQSATKDTVGAIQAITKTIEAINNTTGEIAHSIEQQAGATQEISQTIQQTAEASREISMRIVEVTRAAGATGHSATELLTSAAGLTSQSGTLTHEVDNFLNSIQKL